MRLSTRLGLVALAVVLATAAACSNASQAVDPPASAVEAPATGLRAFTGAATRVVWVQSDGTDPLAAGDQILMGLSTEDAKGERVILGRRQSYVKPLLTPRGDRIVFSTRPRTAVQGVRRRVGRIGLTGLGRGFALAVWENPADGQTWVYLGTGNKDKSYDFPTVSRFPINEPAKTELVWNKTLVSADTFQLSADGRFAAGLFPWPKAGIAELPNKSWEPIGDGCWTAMTTARGPIAW